MKALMAADEAVAEIHDGATVMVAGFLSAPESLIDALVRKGVRELTIISNDTGFAGVGIGKLIAGRLVRRVITSHIGTNPDTQKQMVAGELEVQIAPQGTLAERVRAGGAGLGGFLTPTGVGTVVEEGKQKIEVDGRTYLLELPLRADFALLHATWADPWGNLFHRLSTRNWNPIMAMAADRVLVEFERLRPSPIPPDSVTTPGIFVDALVQTGCPVAQLVDPWQSWHACGWSAEGEESA